jgi:hypothetical protein
MLRELSGDLLRYVESRIWPCFQQFIITMEADWAGVYLTIHPSHSYAHLWSRFRWTCSGHFHGVGSEIAQATVSIAKKIFLKETLISGPSVLDIWNYLYVSAIHH